MWIIPIALWRYGMPAGEVQVCAFLCVPLTLIFWISALLNAEAFAREKRLVREGEPLVAELLGKKRKPIGVRYYWFFELRYDYNGKRHQAEVEASFTWLRRYNLGDRLTIFIDPASPGSCLLYDASSYRVARS